MWWARETAPLTQAELAAHLGISKRTVQNYEAGVGHPSEERLLLWANACDVDFHWLAGDFYPSSDVRSAGASTRRVKSTSNRGCVRWTRHQRSYPRLHRDALAA
jgi:transcriptional regulator with XRE-family HTH domain